MRLPAIPTLVIALTALVCTPATAQSGCGYVSSSNAPPESKGYFPAEIRRIDGQDIDRKQSRHRLDIGTHQIEVDEQIGDSRRGRAKLAQLGNSATRQKRKTLEINVKADGNYQVGAKLLEGQIDTKQPSSYWEPIVWRTLVETCK